MSVKMQETNHCTSHLPRVQFLPADRFLLDLLISVVRLSCPGSELKAQISTI